MKQQGNTANEPISAIPAAISTKTSMLFGLWASAGEDAFNNEIEALQKTIDQYCDRLDGLVAGISVGSEDLYRISPTGIQNGENPGANPDTLVNYISRVRDTVKGSCLSNAPIGHVDTWTAYANSSNQALIEACDWLGMDAYAYFENTKPNSIENGASLFQEALANTKAASGGREVWITETGWPVSGKESGEAVASPKNARTFWKEVGCPLFGTTNTWWYTFQDSAPTTPNPSFGVIGSELTTKPLYDLSCDGSSGGDGGDKTPQSSTKSEAPAPKSSTSASVPASSSQAQTDELPSSSVSVSTTEAVEPVPTGEAPTSEAPTTHEEAPKPVPTSSYANSSVNTPSQSGSAPTALVPTASGGSILPTGTNGNGASTPTGAEPPISGSSKLSSISAAVIAMVLAAGLM